MKTKLPFALALFTLSLGAWASAAEKPPVTITELFKRVHPEFAKKEVIVKRIVLEPSVSAPAHVHPGMVVGYIESGRLEFQIKGESKKSLKTGDIFFEPPGAHHLLARNPDKTKRTVVIAFVENPKGAPLSTPLAHPEKP